MKSLIALAFALALMNVANAALPASGHFVMNYFGNNDTCADSESQLLLPVASNCWDMSSLFGVYLTATDYTSDEISVGIYSNSTCAGDAMLNETLMCDGSCSVMDEYYYSCHYSNFPSTGLTNYTQYTDSNCTTVGLDSVVYNATSQVCWGLDETSSAFPNDYNSTSNVVSILSYSDTNCGGMASYLGTAGSLVCDGTCQADALSGSYQCSYSNSAKLVASLIVTFALMLILA
jgi:hypothetical protein